MRSTKLPKLILVSVLFLSLNAFAETSLPVVDQVKSTVNSEGIGVAKSFLQKYFPTVELQLDMFDYRKATSGILIVAPLSNPNVTKNTFFTQDSVYHRDNRTTVNLGLGYRRLEMDNKVMLGANAFYDYEFPYGNRRTSFGLEARTTVGEANFNQYWGASNWMNAANSLQEKSLGGTDIEVGVPLPYMNWAKVYGRGFIWRGVDGANDLKGTDVSLRAQLPLLPGLAIEGGRRTYTNATPDENFLKISYNLTDMSKPNPSAQWFSAKAYSLDSMENQRYNKVRRENMIMKQERSTEAPLPFGYLRSGGLVWAPISETAQTFADANTECNALNTSGAAGFSSGWRLPSISELRALYAAYPSYSSILLGLGWYLGPENTFRFTWSSSNLAQDVKETIWMFNGGVGAATVATSSVAQVSCVH